MRDSIEVLRDYQVQLARSGGPMVLDADFKSELGLAIEVVDAALRRVDEELQEAGYPQSVEIGESVVLLRKRAEDAEGLVEDLRIAARELVAIKQKTGPLDLGDALRLGVAINRLVALL